MALARDHPHHSWQSWRGRWVKTLSHEAANRQAREGVAAPARREYPAAARDVADAPSYVSFFGIANTLVDLHLLVVKIVVFWEILTRRHVTRMLETISLWPWHRDFLKERGRAGETDGLRYFVLV